MRVLLILPQINSPCIWHTGLAYISAILKESGHQVQLFEINNYTQQITNLLDKIKEFEPAVIGISSNSHQILHAKNIAREIKKKYSLPIFVGGMHPTLQPEIIEDEENFDGVIIGEAEEIFLSLISKIENKNNYLDVNSCWFRDGSKIIKNEIAPLVEDLDKFPFPDRSIFRYFSEDKQKITPRFIFSRGCPYECAYCCNHILKKIYHNLGRYVRWRSVDSAIREIELLREKYYFTHFKIDDDIFSLNKKWLLEFCEKFSKKFKDLTYECNIRPGVIDKESLIILKNSGCVLIKIGVETGNEKLRKEILNRNISNQEIINTFLIAKKINLKTFSFNMVGIPGESKETIRETVELNKIIQPDFMQVTIFYPYPHTILGEICAKSGYLEKDYEDSYMEKTILKLPTISKKEIEKAAKNFKFNIYWCYNKRKAFAEKKSQIKKFIISQSLLHFLAKTFKKLFINYLDNLRKRCL